MYVSALYELLCKHAEMEEASGAEVFQRMPSIIVLLKYIFISKFLDLKGLKAFPKGN